MNAVNDSLYLGDVYCKATTIVYRPGAVKKNIEDWRLYICVCTIYMHIITFINMYAHVHEYISIHVDVHTC